MMPAAPTPVPINDIVGPVWFLPYPVWMIVAAAVLLIVAIALLTWGISALLKKKRPPTPREIALKALEHLRSNMTGVDPYKFGVSVSDAIRSYIHNQHGLAADTQTSIEFLDSIRDNPVFTPNEKAGLSVFLEGTDLLKYARAEAGESEMISLLETAGRLVRGEVQPDGKSGKITP
jgi:hypothetical protein